MNFDFKLVALAAGFFVSTSSFAATIGAGTFNLSGTAVGTNGGIEFYFATQGDETGTINLPTSGVFSDLAPGTHETIQSLTSANGVTPNSPFNFTNWIQLTDGINLDATSIPIPSFPICSGSSPETTGYQCLVNAASPVVLTKTITGVSARINLYGNAHFAGEADETPFTGLFTSPTTNFTTIAAFQDYFDAHGAIPPVSYSASFTTEAAPAVPEPGTAGIVGLSLLGLALLRRKNKSL